MRTNTEYDILVATPLDTNNVKAELKVYTSSTADEQADVYDNKQQENTSNEDVLLNYFENQEYESGERVPEEDEGLLDEIVVYGKKTEKVNYKGVIPTTELRANDSLYLFFKLAIENPVWKKVMKDFYKEYNNAWVYVEQLKDSSGKPNGYGNIAETRFNPIPPADRHGQHSIIINSDILNKSGNIGIDQTLLFMALLHEGIHARKNERYRQTGGTFEGFPGHTDFFERGGGVTNPEAHHNQMGAFNTKELVEGMKKFDDQIRKSGGTVPDYHTEDWYEAMAWYGLDRTQAWKYFEKTKPKEAGIYMDLIKKQIERHEKGINEE